MNCNTQLYIYPTKALVTYCMPLDQAEEVVGELITNIIKVAPLQEYFSDVYMAWELVLAMVGVSIAISVFYSLLIRYFAGCMVWAMIFLLLTLLLAIGIITALMPSTQFLKDIFHYDDLPEPLQDRTYQIVVSIMTLSMFAIGMLIICCMKRQIAICTFTELTQRLGLSRRRLIL